MPQWLAATFASDCKPTGIAGNGLKQTPEVAMNLRNVTRAYWTIILMLLISGCENKPTKDELTQTLQHRVDAAYNHISEVRDRLNRLDNDNWQDVVSKMRESTQAAFVDIENAQYALKKLKEGQ
ncbi:hypothetical protein QF000_006981 [Paraburkholderia atlantica]|uniref:hypothetical protein n=1 Tax=Paraburkholderia atlantica TaxID=2654982 RepID=UPI003D214AE8